MSQDFFTRDRVTAGKPDLTILIGLPRCGKSTWANQQYRQMNATIVSADDVRRALGCEFDPKKEGQVWFVVETAVKALLMRGQNVILDCNSHTVKQRRVWLRLRDLANINFLSFPTPPEAEWKRRCQESNFKWSVIERMKAEYQPLTPGEQT